MSLYYKFQSSSMSLNLISAIIEQDIIAQYEEEELFTEKVITAAIDCLTTDDIICPLCLKYDHFFMCAIIIHL